MGRPVAVEAVRADGRRITAVGGFAELRGLGDADVVDLDGRCLMPGFVDARRARNVRKGVGRADRQA